MADRQVYTGFNSRPRQTKDVKIGILPSSAWHSVSGVRGLWCCESQLRSTLKKGVNDRIAVEHHKIKPAIHNS